ncbi:MAG: acyl carrier protein [Candidatus Cloacimonetes bacterium]|nr:acyl carrier protein [Candidatus Cloacimonadota bacterium]
METNEKIAMLEEMLEIDEGTLKEDTQLDNIAEWDSMSKLSLIVLLDDEFEVSVNGDQIRSLKSIKDILDLMP